MFVEYARISANVEQRRRIVNLEETLRIFRFVPVQQEATKLADPGELFFRVLVCLPGLDRVCRRRREPACFEFGHRSAEDSLWRAELAQKFSGQARA